MKKLSSFIIEGLVCLFVVIVFILTLVFNRILIFSFESSLWFIVTIAVALIAIYYSSGIINIGIRSTIDLVFKQTVIREGVITDIVPYDRSVFSEKWVKGHIRKKECFFFISFFVRSVPFTLISSSSLVLEKNKKIKIRFGRFSHVILEIIED